VVTPGDELPLMSHLQAWGLDQVSSNTLCVIARCTKPVGCKLKVPGCPLMLNTMLQGLTAGPAKTSWDMDAVHTRPANASRYANVDTGSSHSPQPSTQPNG
jgi:hypothetical protein